MRIPRIYHPAPLAVAQTVELTAEAANHVARVLRMPVAAELLLFNGDGQQYASTITAISKRNVQVKIHAAEYKPVASPLQIHLAQAVARAEKMDWILQKATELGVSSITPLITERSGVKLDAERWQKRQQHWEAVIISACEQCGRNQLPSVTQPQEFTAFVAQPRSGTKLILAPEATTPLPSAVIEQAVTIVIGPEGGFSDLELTQAQQAGFSATQFGPRILRTETAAIAAVAVLQMIFGDGAAS
ncbi:MAG: 16S rRNA (uracil(1498)-N(3))-methyltransferase [Gammaproteobacteria bacterium]|nr:16S rRNA (uracil(1498)-N(3))-methyltransferase [Gammaproteobacteria bacterium]